MSDHEHTDQPVDQQLVARAMFTTLNYAVDTPPELELVFDVEHAGTSHAWRTSITLNRDQMIELTGLLVHGCRGSGIDITKWFS